MTPDTTANPAEVSTTEALVLRISPCRERGAVVSCLSPRLGRLAFYEGGGRGTARSDLFQLLELECRPTRRPGDEDGEFYRVGSRTLLEDYSSLAADYGAYQAACWMAAFALRNSQPRLPMPRFFAALKAAMRRLAKRTAPPEAMLTGVGLVFLYEGGWLDTTGMQEQEVSQCEVLLNMALEQGAVPELSQETWRRLWEWTQGRLMAALP